MIPTHSQKRLDMALMRGGARAGKKRVDGPSANFFVGLFQIGQSCRLAMAESRPQVERVPKARKSLGRARPPKKNLRFTVL